MEVLLLCMKVLLAGEWPDRRHDGTPWLSSDKGRRKRKGSLGFKGLLCQVRGDWAWYKTLFSFPSWGSEAICWMCAANKSDKDFEEFGLSGVWRKHRYSPRNFFTLLMQEGIVVSPLFSCPFFTLAMVMVDVLHAMDLGVTQERI